MRIGSPTERPEEHLERRDAEPQRQRHVTIVWPDRIVAASDRRGAGDLGDVVAARGQHKAGYALPREQPEPLLDRPRQQQDLKNAS
jgi:hypothetical protein